MEPLLDEGMGDTLVIRVIPGPPKRIVALLRLHDLRNFSDDEREAWLRDFGETIRELGEDDAQIVVGIRGNFFYGAVASLQPGASRWRIDTGSMVSTRPIDVALAPDPPSAPPAPAEPAQPAPAEPAAADTPAPTGT